MLDLEQGSPAALAAGLNPLNPLPGFPLMPLDMAKVFDLIHVLQAGGVHYGLGCKARESAEFPRFDFPPDLPDHRIDCSGFMRVALYHGTRGAVLLPDGSANQGDFLHQQGYKLSEYRYCLLRDGRVRICIARARPGRPIGHIWGCYNESTFESHGSGGPASRSADNALLAAICDEVYVVG